jgi:hypothetical protein
MRIGRWLSIAAGGLLAACASAATQIEQTSAIQLVDDRFRPELEYATGTIESANEIGVGRKRLLAHVDRKSGALLRFVLAFEIGYHDSGKRSYELANNAMAKTLRMSKVIAKSHCDRQSRCTVIESYLIEIPEADLRVAPAEGYAIKLFARNGPDAPIVVPKPWITALLARVDTDRQRLAAAKP